VASDKYCPSIPSVPRQFGCWRSSKLREVEKQFRLRAGIVLLAMRQRRSNNQ
jgi:hypothetical protein